MRSVMLSEGTERAFLAAREAAKAVENCRFMTADSLHDTRDADYAEFGVLSKRRTETRRLFAILFSADMDYLLGHPQIPDVVEPS